MVRAVGLLILGLTLIAGSVAVNPQSTIPCGAVQKLTGHCAIGKPIVQTVSGGVEAKASRSEERDGTPPSAGKDKSPSPPPIACKTLTECTKKFGSYPTAFNEGLAPFLPDPASDNRLWPGQLPPPLIRPAEPAVAGRVVTTKDVERFLPVQGVVHSEPRGWAVVHVWANFWVEVAPVTVDGELFDTAVQVRFTPMRYLWDYGDGEVAQTETSGASWAQLGQEELTETPTGHLYGQRGKAIVSVRVGYAAQYRVDGGDWLAVQGEVVAPAPPAQMVVVTESTVLTAAP